MGSRFFYHVVVVKSGDYPKAQEIFRKNQKKSSAMYVAMLNGTDGFIRPKSFVFSLSLLIRTD